MFVSHIAILYLLILKQDIDANRSNQYQGLECMEIICALFNDCQSSDHITLNERMINEW